VTDKAFDEGWYQLKPTMQRTFILLILANNLECKIAAIDKFNLSLPSFMAVNSNILYIKFEISYITFFMMIF